MIDGVESVNCQPQRISKLVRFGNMRGASLIGAGPAVHSHLNLLLVLGYIILLHPHIAPINIGVGGVGDSCCNDSINRFPSIKSCHLMNLTHRVLRLLHQ